MEEVKFYKSTWHTICTPISVFIPNGYHEVSFVDYLRDHKIKLPFSVENLKLYLKLGDICVVKDCNNAAIVLIPRDYSTIDFNINKFKTFDISIRNRIFTRRDFRTTLAISYNDIDKL